MTASRFEPGATERWRAVLDTGAALLGVPHLRLASGGEPDDRRSIGGGTIPDGPADSRFVRRALESGETIRVADATQDPRWRNAPETAGGWRAFLSVPVPGRKGALVAMDRRPREFGATAVRHLRHLAEWAAADGALALASGGNPKPARPFSDRLEELTGRILDVRSSLDAAIVDIRRAAEGEADPERRAILESARNCADDLRAMLDDVPGLASMEDGSSAPGETGFPSPGPAGRPAESALRILLAGENPLNRKLVYDLLRSRGHAVEIAADGPEAVEAFAAAAFDIVFMDLRMPGMDGFETVRRMRDLERKSGRRTPIFGIGGGSVPDEEERCGAAGMDGFVARPIRAEALYEALERAGKPVPEAPASPFPSESNDPADSPLDRDGLLEIVGGSSRIARELVRLYLENCPDIFARVAAAAAAADAEALKQSAHALKGMSLNLSAKPVAEAALRLERIGRSGELSGAAAELVRLEAELARLREAMDIMLEELPSD